MDVTPPALLGRDATEGYLTQPNVLGVLRRGPLTLTGTLNFEGYTLRRGELNAGIYGEGYVDRRHPHTLVHEVMLVATSVVPVPTATERVEVIAPASLPGGYELHCDYKGRSVVVRVVRNCRGLVASNVSFSAV